MCEKAAKSCEFTRFVERRYIEDESSAPEVIFSRFVVSRLDVFERAGFFFSFGAFDNRFLCLADFDRNYVCRSVEILLLLSIC